MQESDTSKEKNHSLKIHRLETENMNQAERSEFLSIESIPPPMRTILATRLAHIGDRALHLMDLSTIHLDHALFSF